MKDVERKPKPSRMILGKSKESRRKKTKADVAN